MHRDRYMSRRQYEREEMHRFGLKVGDEVCTTPEFNKSMLTIKPFEGIIVSIVGRIARVRRDDDSDVEHIDCYWLQIKKEKKDSGKLSERWNI